MTKGASLALWGLGKGEGQRRDTLRGLALAWEREAPRSPPGSTFCQLCIFWGNPLFLGGCICSASRLQSLDIRRGDSSRGGGGQSQALGDRDSACCFQRLSQLSKWNVCTKFSRGDEILRRTNSRKRHEGKGERRHKKTQ